MSARVRPRAVAGIAVLVVLGLGTASASALPVASARLGTVSAQACTPSTIAATATDPVLLGILGYASIELTVPAACAGSKLSLTVYAAAGGGVLASASASAVAVGTQRVSTSTAFGGWFQPAPALVATFDGWSVPISF